MATILDLGIPGLGTGILQPKLKHRWRVTFAGVGDGSNSQNLSVQAVNITRPSLQFDEVQLDRYNSRAWVASKYTFQPMTLTIEDDVTGTASQIIQNQIQKQQKLIGAGAQYLPATPEGRLYKFVLYLEQLDGASQVIEKWTVEGCFIQNVDYNELDYAASEAMQITLTVRYDHARQDIGGYNAGLGVATGAPG